MPEFLQIPYSFETKNYFSVFLPHPTNQEYLRDYPYFT